MPGIIALINKYEENKDKTKKPIFFLLMEDDFPEEGLKDIQENVKIAIKYESTTEKDLILIAESIIREHHGISMPYSVFIINY
jgi:hypothetical protein